MSQLRVVCTCVAVLLACMPLSAHEHELSILVFSRTMGFRHGSIPDGIRMFERFARDSGYAITYSEDAGVFRDDTLSTKDVVVFLSTTGDILNTEQQGAFERFIQRGGGFVGLHSASDTEYDWPWYGGLVGAYFSNHPAVQDAEVLIEDRTHGSSNFLPRRWHTRDEWYDFRTNPRGSVHVIASLNSRSYADGSMGYDHPITWCHEYDGGRAWYTAMGHVSEKYTDAMFEKHVLGGLLWAADVDPAPANASMFSTYSKRVLLDDLDQPMQLCYIGKQQFLILERSGRLLLFDEKAGTSTVVTNYQLLRDGEYGALGLALAHDFETTGAVYTLLADVRQSQFRLLRTTYLNGVFDVAHQRTILEFPFDSEECCHAAGDLAVASNGDIFISVGDNSDPFEKDGYPPIDTVPGHELHDAQRTSGNTNDLRGKILRIHPHAEGGYENVDGNLFPPSDALARPEIYVMGVRNPFRISYDNATGHLWWGDVGPDAEVVSPTRGPLGYDEVNRATEPGNFGWPYAIGPNLRYFVNGVETDTTGPINTSRNNTGLTKLPPTQRATIWYPYTETGGSDNVGVGGRSACAGPVVHLPSANRSSFALSDYFENTLLYHDFIRFSLRAVHLDEAGKVLKVVPIIDESDSIGIIDLCVMPDGVLYGLGWKDMKGKTADAQLFKMLTLNKSALPPQARIRANRTNGAVPLTVSFDGSKSLGNIVRYEWDVNGDNITDSTTASPTYTFTERGTYVVTLRVFDDKDSVSSATQEIVAGNTPPSITLLRPRNGQVAVLNEPVEYKVLINDNEDASLSADAIVSQLSLGHDEHAHPLGSSIGASGTLSPPTNLDHGDASDIYTVFSVRATDNAVGTARSLSSTASAIIQPTRKRAEFMTYETGIDTEVCTDEGGGKNLAFIDHDDAFYLYPLDLRDVDSIRIRYATLNGGRLEIRTNSKTGDLLAVAELKFTGGYQEWQTVSIPIVATSAAATYYFVAKNEGSGGLFNINWLEFVLRPGPLDVVPPALEAVEIKSNPANNVAVVLVHDAQGREIRASLCDIVGRTVWSNTMRTIEDPSLFTINTGSLPSGSYMLHINIVGKSSYTSKLVVEH